MGTVTTFIDKTQTTSLLGTNVVKAQNTLNFAVTPVAQNDVVQALKIPAKAYVFRVISICNTAEGGACTADLGDADDPNGFDDAVNFNSAAAVTSSIAGTDNYAEGRYYAAADTLDYTMDHAADAASVTVVALYFIVE
jgi:hypothetical protein